MQYVDPAIHDSKKSVQVNSNFIEVLPFAASLVGGSVAPEPPAEILRYFGYRDEYLAARQTPQSERTSTTLKSFHIMGDRSDRCGRLGFGASIERPTLQKATELKVQS